MNNQEKRKKLIENTMEHLERVILNFSNEMHELMLDEPIKDTAKGYPTLKEIDELNAKRNKE